MNLEEFEKRDYRNNWLRGTSWLITAETLKIGAENILVDYLAALNLSLPVSMRLNKQLLPVYMLLAGCAVEILLKGIIICGTWLDNPSALNKDDFIDIRVPAKGNG